MVRLRVIGPRERLEEALDVVQDVGVLHLAPPRHDGRCEVVEPPAEQAAEIERLQATLRDLEAVDRLLAPHLHGRITPVPPADLPPWAERAATLRAQLEGLAERAAALAEERALLERYEDLVRGFAPLAAEAGEATRVSWLVLRGREEAAVRALRKALSEAAGQEVRVVSRALPKGGTAVAVVVPEEAGPQVDAVLHAAPLEELSAPEDYGGGALAAALPQMRARLEALPNETAAVADQQRDLARAHAGAVQGALAAVHDRLAELDAFRDAAATRFAFVLEGWLPREEEARFRRRIEERLAPEVLVERVGTEEWESPAPVTLKNPALFRPFEVLTRMLPLPAYGTLDPTPFVAVSFPMLFGLILGDVGYGLLLAVLALVIRWRSKPGGTGRAIAAIGGACAAFTIVFGALYGELFGDLGTRLFGMKPLLFSREDALVPALILALGIGVAHILLGLILGAVSAARGEPKKAIGRGLAAVMVVLVVILLLVVLKALPKGVFTPVLVAALVVFPLLVVVEGLLGPIELMSTLANILSYARIMAVGTASVMMAVVANRLVGAVGSVLVGVLFALLFHLVNFAIGVFGPAVHVLRLHYVEFFGKFYSPGGVPYEPLGRWHPDHSAPPVGGGGGPS